LVQIQQRWQIQDWEVKTMATGMRKTGIDVVGDVSAWGAHFCLFYETKEDLLDTLVSYCKSGLESEEYCLWIVAEPLRIEDAIGALKDAVPALDRYVADSRLEIASARDWFLQGGTFDGKRLTAAWYEKLAGVSARGYAGMRVTGDTTWLSKKDWSHFCDYEDGLNEVIGNQRLAVLCTYPLAGCGAPQILDVVRTHQFVLARRHGSWDVLETATLKRAKAELKGLNEELEQRVVQRTSELMKASEELREAQAELARVSRLTTMGEFAASIAHEVNQPLTAVTNNGSACLRLLANRNLDPEVLRRALEEIVADGTRASAVIARIRASIKKAPAEKNALDINEVIQEVLALAGHELQKNRILVECQLTKPLPLVLADRIQLQQVLLNLVMNGIEAMTAVTDRPRVLWVQSRIDESGHILVAVQDSGTGLGSDADRVFTPFFTTKGDGMGMGLPISRSLIEGHGGRLWAEPNVPHGAVFSFTLPAA
jgi:C4-dicarboxylate-specific signal transduction histidine kinase